MHLLANLPPRPDIIGMFLLGLGLPSQLEHEDIGMLLAAQERMQQWREEQEMAAWQAGVRQSFN